MEIKYLRCSNFRNIENLEFSPFEEMNVICGENAQGKTNILEALWLFCGMKSFRASKDSSFIRFGEERAKNEIVFMSHGIENNASMTFEEKRTAALNDKPLSNPSRLAGSFNAVIFSPLDLSLIKDGPQIRRKFLDMSICQLYPSYTELLRDYTRAVMQRNQVIKEYKYDVSLSVLLDSFEESIADKGIKIIDTRKKYIKKLIAYIPDIYSGLSSGKESINIEYVCSSDYEDLRRELYDKRKEDTFSGVTSVGPHRDDLVIKINGISARSYGSQGQKRSAALSLKLATAEVLNNITGEYPVCLLDDVMSELDPERQNYILNHIKGRQSFITCCDPSNTKGLLDGRIIEVKNGGII